MLEKEIFKKITTINGMRGGFATPHSIVKLEYLRVSPLLESTPIKRNCTLQEIQRAL